MDSLTSALETLNIGSSSNFAGVCEKISQGSLSHPKSNYFERLASKETVQEGDVQCSISDDIIDDIVADEDCIFDDSNVFSIVGRTPPTIELLEVSNLSP